MLKIYIRLSNLVQDYAHKNCLGPFCSNLFRNSYVPKFTGYQLLKGELKLYEIEL